MTKPPRDLIWVIAPLHEVPAVQHDHDQYDRENQNDTQLSRLISSWQMPEERSVVPPEICPGN
jgi:hypothetical protein